ncbi:ATP-dependent RecD-like DNA helicase [Agrilactobacillus yilanensis]|uniref:ATP-dependent RecD2 DNA helicase n=1 Tax=Agrilactobacillus yilanensis TaxID=2485997 RepID=A0ABW4J453_9LACO|nr:ATP-dependent RecD-like DNA helicase [Agrilactobacillus yilanensis]
MNEPTAQQHFVTGTVTSIFFQNPDNFYKILLIKVQSHDLPDFKDDEIVVTGMFGDIKEDQVYTFKGHSVDHPRYGFQFKAQNYETQTPTSKDGLVGYLSGAQFKGIGPKTAERIVAKLGINAIDQILKDPSNLAGLGLSQSKRNNLVQALQDNVGMEKAIIGLNTYGFGSSLATQIYQKYKENTLKVLSENPYQLVYDINGIGFKRADQIAEKEGITAEAPERYQAGILQILNDLTFKTGDTYTDADQVLDETIALLESSRRVPVDTQRLIDQMTVLAQKGQLISQEHRLYPDFLFRSEWQIAEHLNRLYQADKVHLDDATFSALIESAEQNLQIQYDQQQKAAIRQALESSVSLLTGGPGTGKTTVVNGIVYCFAQYHEFSLDVNDYQDTPFPISLAAPTGRAAKRLSETTGLPAGTIHRLLGLNGREERDQLAVTNELEGKLLVVDEMSMVDTGLFRQLVKAVPSGMHLVLVGDKDQLPSVGPGQVFADLLSAKVIAGQALERIYRQNEQSSIIDLAHEINEGRLTADFFKNKADRSFIRCPANQIPNVIGQVVAKAKARDFTSKDMQILIPMYKGIAGIDHLNPLVQDIMNPKKSERTKEISFGNFKYRIGDKVLHLVNSPDLNVFNGEIGQIVAISLAKENIDKVDQITIDFDGNEVTYKRSEWARFTLAYCTSIHKAQGSEFPMVILPLVGQFHRMLKRNLLYTAVTRAKSLLIMIGEPDAFEAAVTSLATNRKTSLVQRLLETFKSTQLATSTEETPQAPATNPETTILTMTLIQNQSVDPMIGMQDITPYTFNTQAKEAR